MSQRRGRDDGSLQPGEGDLPEIPPEWGHIVIPDDPRELAAEAEQVRLELRAEARAKQGWSRLIFTRRWQRYGLSGPLVSLVLMLVAAMASLMLVVLPSAPTMPERAPLAAPTVEPGSLGGLLPDVRLANDRGQIVTVRELRPGVLLLMPVGCNCGAVAADLVRVSRDTMVSVGLVGADGTPALPPNSSRSRIHTLTDPEGLLIEAVTDTSTVPNVTGPVAPSTDPTAILVRSDGVIVRVIADLRDAGALRGELAGLLIA